MSKLESAFGRTCFEAAIMNMVTKPYASLGAGVNEEEKNVRKNELIKTFARILRERIKLFIVIMEKKDIGNESLFYAEIVKHATFFGWNICHSTEKGNLVALTFVR